MTLEYVLITPARNEELTMSKTIESVTAQTVLPKKWIIVSDGSVDGTDAIVMKYAKEHEWIELIRMDERRDRSFAAKAVCFNTAYERVKKTSYDIIGNLDADISFDTDYFEFLLSKFAEDPAIGCAGTRYVEEDNEVANYSYQDVAGQCQMFRRECLAEVGGYFPSKYGGVDWIAVRMARMNGWKTITFNDKTFFHHRAMSSAEANKWIARFRTGRKDYVLGNHPLWQVLRVMYQLTKRPYVIGGLLLSYGYVHSMVTRVDRPIPAKLIAFHRQEQMQQLKSIVMEGFSKSRMGS